MTEKYEFQESLLLKYTNCWRNVNYQKLSYQMEQPYKRLPLDLSSYVVVFQMEVHYYFFIVCCIIRVHSPNDQDVLSWHSGHDFQNCEGLEAVVERMPSLRLLAPTWYTVVSVERPRRYGNVVL